MKIKRLFLLGEGSNLRAGMLKAGMPKAEAVKADEAKDKAPTQAEQRERTEQGW